jgi:hypothetical protein
MLREAGLAVNRVICCYQYMPQLAIAAAERAGTLVMSFPNDRWWTRLGLTLANLSFSSRQNAAPSLHASAETDLGRR